jgi:hypothetical protein
MGAAMKSPVHDYLDGELPLEALTAAEQAQAMALEGVIRGVTSELHARSLPDLTPRVIAALPAETRPSAHAERPHAGRLSSWVGRLVAWLWNPRPVRLRPVYGLAVAALLLLGFAGVWQAAAPKASPAATAADAPWVYVQFRLEAPEASRVTLAGSFTDWQPLHDLHQTAPGVWSVMVPLTPGVYDYTFVIDGSDWIPDPHAPQVPDSFGGTNSRLTLLPPRSDT